MMKVISILFPFILLGGLELTLRLFHYGHDLRLFITAPDNNDYYIFNPDASRRYFSNPGIATTGNRELFKKVKDPNTLRIFVLGESTTIGYPYFHNGSFHRWLQYRLMHTCPDKRLEIINLSLTGVNSYTIAGFAKELLPYQPDAVLIYTGHNEYYGCLGVGSTDRIAGNPFLIHGMLWLRDFRITQWMANMLQRLSPGQTATPGSEGKTRMELMVRDQEIPFGSERYERGIAQFKTNMDHTLRLLNEAQVPVFVSNVVSTEKDLFPFTSITPDSTKFPGFMPLYKKGQVLLAGRDTAAAQRAFLAADSIFPAHAGCNYYLANLLLQQSDTLHAKQYFDKARDLDALRFRAPSRLNLVILELCSRYKNTHLVDANAVFEANSEGHIIGNNLILEHVHPNLKGYALLSDAFYNALKQTGVIRVTANVEMSFAALLQTMPLTVIDSLSGAYKIARLKRSKPFVSTALTNDTTLITTTEEQLAYDIAFRHTSWAAAMEQLYHHYNQQGDLGKAGTIAAAFVQEHPTETAWYEETANYMGKENHPAAAIFYFQRAFALSPSFKVARMLFVLHLQLDQTQEALPYLDYALQNNEQHLNLEPVKALLMQVMQLQQVAAGHPGNIDALLAIADKYLRMGNKAGAVLYVEKVLHAAPANKSALALLDQLKKV